MNDPHDNDSHGTHQQVHSAGSAEEAHTDMVLRGEVPSGDADVDRVLDEMKGLAGPPDDLTATRHARAAAASVPTPAPAWWRSWMPRAAAIATVLVVGVAGAAYAGVLEPVQQAVVRVGEALGLATPDVEITVPELALGVTTTVSAPAPHTTSTTEAAAAAGSDDPGVTSGGGSESPGSSEEVAVAAYRVSVAEWAGCVTAIARDWYQHLTVSPGDTVAFEAGRCGDRPLPPVDRMALDREALAEYARATRDWLHCAREGLIGSLRQGADAFDPVAICGPAPAPADFGIEGADEGIGRLATPIRLVDVPSLPAGGVPTTTVPPKGDPVDLPVLPPDTNS